MERMESVCVANIDRAADHGGVIEGDIEQVVGNACRGGAAAEKFAAAVGMGVANIDRAADHGGVIEGDIKWLSATPAVVG